MPLSAQRPTATTEEIRLAAAIRDGDERAFTTAVERHYGCMLAVATAFVLSPDTAAHVVHDAWTEALDQVERFDGRTALRPWLLRFVVRLAAPLAVGLDRGTPDARAPAVDRERFRGGGDAFPGHWRAYPRDWRTLPDDVRRGESARRVVEAAIASLPVEQRAIIAMRDIAGCAHREACDVLEVPEDIARERLHRARCRVRAALERHFDD
jgi:RNA polymerase sigma-70 factor (ECF subfamily)